MSSIVSYSHLALSLESPFAVLISSTTAFVSRRLWWRSVRALELSTWRFPRSSRYWDVRLSVSCWARWSDVWTLEILIKFLPGEEVGDPSEKMTSVGKSGGKA